MRVDLLTPEVAKHYWPTCRPIIEKAFRDIVQINSVDDYVEGLADGTFQLSVITDDANVLGAVITSIDEGTNAKVLNVLSLAGEKLPLWIHLVDRHLIKFGKSNQCDAIEYVGRRGFTHFVPEYKEDGVVYVRMLGDE